ncbi:hypothetical protein JXA32_13015 [Candidatus Sumerlaeota bacterium]|nr:hypothetical protein [Candidatus Sumerlaeota bacterium]
MPRKIERPYSGRIHGSPLPRVPEGVRIPAPVAAPPHLPRVETTPDADVDNPVFRYQLGGAAWRRHRYMIALGVISLYLSVPLAWALCSALAPNPYLLITLILTAMHIALFTGMMIYSTRIGLLGEGDAPRDFLRDMYLSFLSPEDLARGISRARMNRLLYLALALAPFELLAVMHGWLYNPDPCRTLFFPVFVVIFWIDLLTSMQINLTIGLRLTVESKDERRLMLKTYALMLAYFPLMFILFLIPVNCVSKLFGGFGVMAVTTVWAPGGQMISMPGYGLLILLIVTRAFYVLLVRVGYALRSQSLYYRNFDAWLRRWITRE